MSVIGMPRFICSPDCCKEKASRSKETSGKKGAGGIQVEEVSCLGWGDGRSRKNQQALLRGSFQGSGLSSQVDGSMGERAKAGEALGPEASISWSLGAQDMQHISRWRC